jgi:hypothetical protein
LHPSGFDLRRQLYRITGVDLTQIDGIQVQNAQTERDSREVVPKLVAAAVGSLITRTLSIHIDRGIEECGHTSTQQQCDIAGRGIGSGNIQKTGGHAGRCSLIRDDVANEPKVGNVEQVRMDLPGQG